jgi:hypothetical protein
VKLFAYEEKNAPAVNNVPAITLRINRDMEAFVRGTVGNQTLEQYIISDICPKLVKFVLDYEEKDSKEQKITSIDDLFNHVKEYINSMSDLPKGKENEIFMKSLDNIIAFFQNIMPTIIKYMKKLIDNYLDYLQNEYNHIKIIHLFLTEYLQRNNINPP